MKRSILFIALLLCICSANAQNKKLNYTIAIAKFQLYYNSKNADSLYAMYSAQMRAALSVEKTKDLLENLNAQFGKLLSTSIVQETAENTIYTGVFEKGKYNIVFPLNDKNQLSGLFFQPVQKEESNTATAEKEPSNFNAQTQSGATLYGTLKMPESTKSKPNIVLIIAGSGPTDRNCNSAMGLKSNAFKMLADSLAQAGIASVRYDKRGVGESMGASSPESETRFDDMVNDAIKFIQKIKKDGRFGKIIIAGHSEGSLIGMIAANKEPVDKLISISGAGESADKILMKQLNGLMPEDKTETTKILKSLKEGKTVAQVSSERLSSIFRNSVQPYMISWFAYDPQTEIKTIRNPILIIQGTTDLQVSVEDAQFLKAANTNAQLSIIKGMNHVLKNASSDKSENLASYNQPELPIVSEFAQVMIQFCR
ncbi:MAG: alpha/beta fold hydrolase [Phycisphaerales bacterium]|nr:alpha/beta fold hydrolase [Phycisphaerales bacterium]